MHVKLIDLNVHGRSGRVLGIAANPLAEIKEFLITKMLMPKQKILTKLVDKKLNQ
jgi:hypothetical protein